MKTWKNILPVVIICLAGCADFSNTTHSATRTYISYNNTLPNTLEEVFATCNEPLSIEPGMESINLSGDCEFNDVNTPEAMSMLLALALAGNQELSEPIPEIVDTMEITLDDFPWPVQNCVVEITAEIHFNGLNLYNLTAGWTTHDNAAGIHVDWDFHGSQHVADAYIEADVSCPKALAEAIVRPIVENNVEGWRTVTASDMDLDLWVTFEGNGDELAGTLDLDFDVGDLEISLGWTKLEKYGVDRDDIEDDARATLEDVGNDMLTAALSDLPDEMASLLSDPVPEDKTICDVTIWKQALRIETTEDSCLTPNLIDRPPFIPGQ